MEKYTYKEYLETIGKRIKLYRVYSNISQKELEEKSGVSIRTLSRLEQGLSIQLDSLIRILYALDLQDNIFALIPDQTKRPSMYLKENNNLRQRSHKNANTKTPFTWGGDE